MNGYEVPYDGSLHVNYSSLKRCNTPKGVLSVIKELNGEKTPFDGETVQIGKIRHEQWAGESKKTGYTPLDFKDRYYKPVDFVEQEFKAEIFKGVILHSRLDSVSLSDKAVIDYKKVVKGARQFLNDWQLKVYAVNLMLNGYEVNKLVHLCEVWEKNEAKIIGYQALERPIDLSEVALVKQWLRVRANNLNKCMIAYDAMVA